MSNDISYEISDNLYDEDDSERELSNEEEESGSLEHISFDDDSQHSILMTDAMNASNSIILGQQADNENDVVVETDQNNNEMKTDKTKVVVKRDDVFQTNNSPLISSYNVIIKIQIFLARI